MSISYARLAALIDGEPQADAREHLLYHGPQLDVVVRRDGEAQTVRGIVDTGSGITAVDTSLVEGLEPFEERDMVEFSSRTRIPHYRLCVSVAGATVEVVRAVDMSLLRAQAPSLKVVIGRDMLTSLVMVYDGRRGEFRLLSEDD